MDLKWIKNRQQYFWLSKIGHYQFQGHFALLRKLWILFANIWAFSRTNIGYESLIFNEYFNREEGKNGLVSFRKISWVHHQNPCCKMSDCNYKTIRKLLILTEINLNLFFKDFFYFNFLKSWLRIIS